MGKHSLRDGTSSFDVAVLKPEQPSRVVLFAVGSGGNPERHAPLLAALVARGCMVVAPHFERLLSSSPTEEDLVLRARRLRLALDSVALPEVPIVGVGHSIGATMLLALAGGRVWMRAGQPVAIAPDERLERLVLMAPVTGFFQAPGALDAVRTPLLVWAGEHDTITPPAQAEFLQHALGERVPVDLRIVEGAGHFSFMNLPPPQTTEPLPDREAFLTRLTAEVCEFLTCAALVERNAAKDNSGIRSGGEAE
jgi:pimeloyl-ACP methyl ester carboxylesterase